MHYWCVIAMLMVFVISNVFAICPLSIRMPCPMPRIPLTLVTAPILAITLLCTTQPDMHYWCIIAMLMAFVISNVFAVRPLPVRMPRPMPRIQLTLVTAPILAIALLCTTQFLDIIIVCNRMIGTQGAKLFGVLGMALVLRLVASVIGTNIWKICMPIVVAKLILDFSWDGYCHARSKRPCDNPIRPRGSAIVM